MFKKFFISMLGTMAGLWLSILILGFGLFMTVIFLASKSLTTKDISGDKILYVNLAGSIPEREQNISVNDILSIMDQPADGLATIMKAIRISADDKNIKGIYLNCAGCDLGIAARSEIISAIKDFKKSGKWVYAYADDYSQGDYYVATAADSVYLNPVGSLTIGGLSSSTMFYKDLMEKLGIGVNVVRVGSFKSAVEPFLRMDMSPESRLQTSVFLNQIWGDMRNTIAENMSLPNAEVINQWADSIPFTWDPERYIECGAISALKYREDFEDMIRCEMNIGSDEELPFVTPAEYINAKGDDIFSSGQDHIAVLYADGDIVQSGKGGIVAEDMVPQIRELAYDDNVKGLILRVNSPGGSAFASEQIWKALENFKTTGKPFYVSMSDYAASGGYYISCGADVIYSDPSTLTGSIGIFGIIPNIEDLMTKKIGLGYATVETNKNSNFPNLFSAPSSQQINSMQQYVNRGYETFTSRVAQGRDMSVDSVKAIGGGRVWDGISAKNIGLVDKLGGLYDAIDAMTADLGMSNKDFICYPQTKTNFLRTIIDESRKNIEFDMEGLTPSEIVEYANLLNSIKNMDPLQARMETIKIK